MARAAHNGGTPAKVRVLPRAPVELTREPLIRLGEGIGKVVYASDHWVIKRERRPSEILALIATWKFLRRVESMLPAWLKPRIVPDPAKKIRLLLWVFRGFILSVPKSIWFTTHAGEYWRWYTRSEVRGAALAEKYLTGTSLIPERVTFPHARVRVSDWPGWLVVSEATERVETTLDERINDLARSLRFDEIQVWLDRLLTTRKAGWQLGLFSLDAHLKNFGVLGDRIVLLDTGGLTNRWPDIEARLKLLDDFLSPHARLGLQETLRDRPDIAERFDAQWRALVNTDEVRRLWPKPIAENDRRRASASASHEPAR